MPRIQNLEELKSFTREFLAGLQPGRAATVVALYGDLGAGKTAFVKALAKELGVEDTVSSPTFVLQKIYALPKQKLGQKFTHLIHFDAYRLLRSEELQALSWKELIAEPGNLICIEWAERVEELLPKGAKRIRFTHLDETTREIRVEV